MCLLVPFCQISLLKMSKTIIFSLSDELMFANLPFSAYRSDSIPTAGSSGSAYSDKPISNQLGKHKFSMAWYYTCS